MEIRKLTAEDYEAHQHIASLAFGRGAPPTFTTEIYDQPDRQRIGIYENGRLQASLGILDFEFYFGKDRRPCGGIFGVASDPAMRGKGFAGTLVKHSLGIMRDKGQFLSSLWPFDFRYYRRYGWEAAAEARWYTAPLELLPHSKETEHVEGVYENVVPVIAPIYERKAVQYNGMLARSAKRWEQKTASGGNRRQSAYIYRRDGMAEGYALIKYGEKEDELEATELVALTARAYLGLSGVARRHAMTVKKLKWWGPANDFFPSLIAHWDIETKVEPSGMNRVVDVRAALSALKPDQGLRGEALVGISDEYAPWNSGVWRIAIEDGSVEASLTNRDPGVLMDIQAFSQAYWGTPSLLDLRRWDRIEVREEVDYTLLDSLLPPTPVWLYDDF